MTTTPSTLTCRCLNFNIHPQKLSFRKCDPSHLSLSTQEEADAFFGASVAEIKLGLGGITTKYQFLVKKRSVGEWQVYSCLGCRSDVYAEADGKLLVSSMLEHEPNKIESLQGSQGYSPCYRIVLQSDNGDMIGTNAQDSDLQVDDPKVDTAVRLINEQLAKFLQQEQDCMEQRIKIYQEQQNKKFNDLRRSATNDREAMVMLVTSLVRQEIPDTLSEALLEETSERPVPVPLLTNSAVSNHREANGIQGIQEKQTELYCNIKNMSVARQRITTARRPRTGSYQSYLLSESVDTSQIFQLDGFNEDDDSGPFPPASSEDEADTDDSSLNDEPRTGMRESQSEAQYASSLPVNVPAWTPSLSSHHFDEDEDEEERRALHAANPERIGQDIQALARSVHDGTEMFGDLPRPRLNTGGFKSRPI
ncbi:uncharacterized protein LOC135394097 [Ornithodoros turicata]|uniref:uncharacterized protein LOC135394097 n=1 Tax=Ornithodoros turicata TaxID=34597 RepID=UPI0031399354